MKFFEQLREVSECVEELKRDHRRQYYTSLAKWARPHRARSPEQLTDDTYAAHDRIKDLVRENDRLRTTVFALDKLVRWLLKASIALLVASWALFATALRFLLPYAIHGMAK